MRRPWPTRGLLRHSKKKILQTASMDSPCDQKTHIEAKKSLYKILTHTHTLFAEGVNTDNTHLTSRYNFKSQVLKGSSRNCMADFIGVNISTL
jgi:hypothetical protein